MEFSQSIKPQKKRSKFFAMVATYSLGVFNDNYFKQAALLLAVAAGKNSVQGLATLLFSLPFILFSAHAGWLADRFPKKKVVIGSKLLELVAMLIGAAGIITSNWLYIIAMVGLMGVQSTIFSPALNGSIPEIFPEDEVAKANAMLKLFTTLAILFGIATAGVSLDQNWMPTEIPFGQLLVAGLVLSISLLGLFASLFVHKKAPTKNSRAFPWSGPLNSIYNIKLTKKDPPLLLALIGSCFFYGFSSLGILLINTYGIQELGYTRTTTSMLSVSLMLGICVGSFISAKISNGKNWIRLLGPSLLGVGIGFLAAGYAVALPIEVQSTGLIAALLISGCFGGIFLIPITSFIQMRPDTDEKGKVIGTGNFMDFTAIMLSGQLFNLLDKNFNPSMAINLMGGTALIMAGIFFMAAKHNKVQL